MSDYDADSRDAAYLACQLHTNGVVLAMKARMRKAREVLHQHLLEVLEEGAIPLDIVDIQVPRIDTSVSRLRHRDSSSGMPAVTSIPPPLRAR